VRRLLLVNATSRGDTLDDVVRAYGRGAGSELAGAILTKVDEALSLAPALDALIRHRLELFTSPTASACRRTCTCPTAPTCCTAP
jgi:flagellar biosynthesis protein FlhF